jgi:hypothetical protein
MSKIIHKGKLLSNADNILEATLSEDSSDINNAYIVNNDNNLKEELVLSKDLTSITVNGNKAKSVDFSLSGSTLTITTK